MKGQDNSRKIFHKAGRKTSMVVAIIFVFLMLAIQFTTVISSVTTSSVPSDILNQSAKSNSKVQSPSSTYFGKSCYMPQLISSFGFPNNCGFQYYSLNRSLYIPMNHNMLIMGPVPFKDPKFYSYQNGCLGYNETIVVLTSQGHEKNIVTFDSVSAGSISCTQTGFGMSRPYISSAILDQINKNVYISIPVFSNVSIFNLTACNITGAISVGKDPVNITVDQQTGYIYVINRYSNNVSVINPYTEKVVASINVGISPDASIYDPYNQYLYVINSGSDSISVINTTYNSVTATMNVGSDPTDMLFDPQNHMIYVNNEKSGCISVIETQYNSVEKIINLPEPLFKTNENMVYYEKTGTIYAGEDTSNITVINTTNNKIADNIVNDNYFYPDFLGNLTLDSYNNSLIIYPIYDRNGVVNLTTDSLEGFISISMFNFNEFSSLFINNPFAEKEYFIYSHGSTISVYTFNVTYRNIVTPIDLYPIIIIVSIVLLAVVIIWRIQVRRSQYKEYIP